jgi:hypothetical protein
MTSAGAFIPNQEYKGIVAIGGSGNFLGAVGVSSAKTNDTPRRSVNITFYKNWTYPFGV